MDIVFIILSFSLLIIGLIGSVLPILPGPLLTYLAFLTIYFFIDVDFDKLDLVICTFFMALVSLSDYFLQFFGIKKFGGGSIAIYGTFIGIIFGCFFSPFGLIIGAFIGAFIGAILEKKNNGQAIKIAFGSLIGFVFGTLIKIIFSVYMIYIIVNKLLYLF